MTALVLRVLWVSLTTSVVLLPLLMCSGRILRRYRAKSCALLWLLLTLRLLLPVQLPLSRPPVRVEIPGQELISYEGESSDRGAQAAVSLVLPEEKEWFGEELVGLIWIGGVMFTLSAQLFLCRAARKELLKGAKQWEEDNLLSQRLGGTCPVFRTEVSTAMTLGLIHPVILLPEVLPQEDLAMILRHELCHIRRRDLWYKSLLGLCACVHWFNPLVWKLGRVVGETLELCCDEMVVAGEDGAFRRHYGQVLLRSAAAGRNPGYAARFGSGDLKGRLMNLFAVKKNGAALVCISLCAAVSLGSLVGCEKSAAREEPEKNSPISVEIVSGEDGDVAFPKGEGAEERWLWPVKDTHAVSASWGERYHPVTGEKIVHDGVDIPAPAGTAVVCTRSGQVMEADFDLQKGNFVRISHENGYETVYAQLTDILVETGKQVARGEVIGTVGATGMATGAHLHFGVADERGDTCNPLILYPDMIFPMWEVTKDLGLSS